jgi:hypothetical protein
MDYDLAVSGLLEADNPGPAAFPIPLQTQYFEVPHG